MKIMLWKFILKHSENDFSHAKNFVDKEAMLEKGKGEESLEEKREREGKGKGKKKRKNKEKGNEKGKVVRPFKQPSPTECSA